MKQMIPRLRMYLGLFIISICLSGCSKASVDKLNTELTRTPSQVATATVIPTGTSKLSATSNATTPTIIPTTKPTPKPTATPTAKPTPKPTATPTAKPTPKPTATPTAKPTSKPTKQPVVKVTATPTPKVPKKPVFTGKSYVLIEANTKETLASKNATKRVYPASTIKLLTALTALEHGNLKDKITARQEVLSNIDYDVAAMGVVAGTTHTLAHWLNMMLIPSNGDVADTIADGLSDGDMDLFIKWMNQKAQELGMENTHVDNAIGLDIGNGFNNIYSTAEDIGKLAVASMQSGPIRRIVKRVTYKTPATKQMPSVTIKTTNHFLKTSDYDSNLFEIIGTKTGYTDASGLCLVATATDAKGRELICVYLGGTTRRGMYQEIKDMFEYYYKQGNSQD